jgi:hypothetical protein
MDRELDLERKAKTVRATIASFTVTAFTAGIVTFLLRTASLMTALFSSIPLWRGFDPIAILAKSRKEDKQKEEPAGITEKPHEKLFDGEIK